MWWRGHGPDSFNTDQGNGKADRCLYKHAQAGKLDADWLNKRPAETRLGVEVVEVSRPAATNNELGGAALAA